LLHREARSLGQARELTHDAHADVLADELRLLLAREACEKVHERLDFKARAAPVVHAEGVERQKWHLELCGFFERRTNSVSSSRVAIPTNSAAPPCPAPVAVHDDGDVARY